MPGMDGLACLAALQELQHGAPVVVVTALSDPQKREQAMNAGAADYVLQPDLFAVLPELLKRHLPSMVLAIAAPQPCRIAAVYRGCGWACRTSLLPSPSSGCAPGIVRGLPLAAPGITMLFEARETFEYGAVIRGLAHPWPPVGELNLDVLGPR